MDNQDKITELFLKSALEQGSPEKVESLIGSVQEVLVSLFSLYIVMQGKEHQSCGDKDCQIIEKLPSVVESFKTQLMHDLDVHVDGNCKVNGIVLEKSHNQRVFDDIMQTLNQAE